MRVSRSAVPLRPRFSALARIAFALMLLVPSLSLAGRAYAAAPRNDDFANARLLRGTYGVIDGTTVDATHEVDEPTNQGKDADVGTVWFRVTLGVGETLVAHTCATSAAASIDPNDPLDTYIGAYRAIDSANTAPTAWNQIELVQENDDFGNLAANPAQVQPPSSDSTNSLVRDQDCRDPDTDVFSWIRITESEETRTIWLQVSPYSTPANETPDVFTLTWYKSSLNGATPQITSVKLTNSRTEPSECLITFKAKGINFNTWVNMWLNNGATDTVDSGFVNRRGVLSVTYTGVRDDLDNTHSITAGLKYLNDVTLVSNSASYVTNNCTPA